jgi:murein L,D-transpeptidase YcbB/YkuD
MFPNQENVYLHDTNNRSLFQKTMRALSHGCVRVEKPQELAEYLLRNEPTWPKEKILAAMKTTKQQQANLKERVPILIVYHPVTANEAGELTFHKDIYGREPQLPAANPANVDVNKVGSGVVADTPAA